MPRVVCTQRIGGPGGRMTTVGKNYDDDDPLVIAAPFAFVPLDEWLEQGYDSRPVEQATAAPGEKRRVRKPAAKKPAAKKGKK